MFEIDRHKFGAFVAALRKEKGYTQKELAAILCVSDKAVSKWETGVSIPDVALLVPLSETLGVTVTELLNCRRTEAPLDSAQVEDLVKTAITYSEESAPGKRRLDRKRLRLYILFLLIAAAEVGVLHILGYTISQYSEALQVILLLCPIFGLYFMVLAAERLPAYYDENSISIIGDGFLSMRLPGVRFHNRNWPHILRVGRIWSMGMLVGYPVLHYAMLVLAPEFWAKYETYVMLVLLLGGLFVPMILVGRKYK